MIKKILLALDGSPHATKAAEYAKDIALQGSAEVTALFVAHIPQEVDALMGTIPADLNLDKLLRKNAEPIFDAVAPIFATSGITLKVLVQTGNPADEILLEAKTGNYDLIIVGNRGLSKIEGLFLGSVSDRVAHVAPCPVLIVK